MLLWEDGELAPVPVNFGMADRLEEWFRAHPLYRGAGKEPVREISSPDARVSLTNGIVRLALLRDAGLLSSAEFELAKAKLLR